MQISEQLRGHAQRVDEALAVVYGELKGMSGIYSELGGGGFLTERQVSFAMKFAGLGEFVTLPFDGNRMKQPLATSVKTVVLNEEKRNAA